MAKKPDVQIRYGRENPAGHFGLSPHIFSHETDERFVILPSHLCDPLQLSDNSGQCGSGGDKKRAFDRGT